MFSKISLTLLLLLMMFLQTTYGQESKQEQALAKGMEAIRLMDDGKLDESISLLEEAQKLDPDRFDYPYERALAYYMKKDYKTAIKILEKIRNHQDATERLYQLLGNSYDMAGKSGKALEAYDAGLKIFPKSGIIFLEKGNVYWGKEEYDKALPFYEKGIEVDPDFPSNYYRAALLFCSSSESVWGLIYGEIFMNLERNSKRTAEISKVLFDTYNDGIKVTSDTSMTVGFCQQMTMDAGSLKDPDNFKLPFCMIYETTLLLSVAFEKNIDIHSLDRIRTSFTEQYFNKGNEKNYPNSLFSYQKQIIDAGHFSAYNHWILMKGDEDGFVQWKKDNEEKWNSFVKWFSENHLTPDENNRFHRNQY